MAKVILQIPMDKKLRDEATKVAKVQGFSSLQELIRVFLTQMIQGKFILSTNIEHQ